MQKLKTFFAALAIAFSFVLVAAPAGTVLAQGSTEQACEAIKAVSPTAACDSKAKTQNRLTKVIKVVIQILSLVGGIIAVIMLIVGGLKYVTSQGDSNAAASAKNTIIYAVVGLVIVVFAQIIVRFVLSKSL